MYTNTRKPLILIAALFSFFLVHAQDYQLSCLDYKWDEKPMNYTPDSVAKANATVVLLMRKVNEYRFNEQTKQLDLYYLVHTIKYVNDNKSIEENNKIYIQSTQSQKIFTVKVRVIIRGKVVYEAGEKDFKEVEEEGHKYNMLAVESLEKGSLIEYISIIRHNEFELYDDDYFQVNSPVNKAEFYLIVPGHTDFRCKGYNGFGPITDSTLDGRHIYYGVSRNISAIDNEEKYSLINANKQRIEYVYYYNKETKKMNAKWPELGRTFFDRINYNYDKNIKDLNKILAKIELKNSTNDTEKIFMIENFLKTNITIDNEHADGASFLESLKKKVATQFRFNQIMAQTFRHAGIPVEVILTCAKDYKRFDPNFDSWSFLRNVLFYMPGTKQFIDPSQTFKRAGFINSDFLGQDGLFIKTVEIGDAVSATAIVKNIPANDVNKSRDEEKYSASFNADLTNITIHYDRDMNGYSEQGLKSLYYVVNDEKKKEFIEDFVKGLAKKAKIENLKVENYDPTKLDEVNKPFAIKADVITDYYVEPVGDNKILLKVGELIGQQSEMYQDKPRFTPMDIDFAHSYNREIIINIPAGYKLKGLDKLNMKYTYTNAKGDPSFGFVSSYTEEAGKLVITCTEYYNNLTYPLEQFNDYKRVINAAADFNKITILLEK